MGLTIHWTLGMNRGTKPETVVKRLETLRAHALTLGMKEVSEVRTFAGKAATGYENYRDENHPDHDWFWYLIQSGVSGSSPRDEPFGGQVVGFRTWPGEGCEEANFGLVLLKSGAWKWHSFCKTQYAGDPECGGVANFLRCHLAVVSMLDQAKRCKLLKGVSDEGEFYEKRDVEALAREVGEWDAMIAAVVGQLMDTHGGQFEAPILNRQDFEHLEAKGRDIADRAKEGG